MAETDPMSGNERGKVIHWIWARYKDNPGLEKCQLLDEAEKVTSLPRKSLLRLLNGLLSRLLTSFSC